MRYVTFKVTVLYQKDTLTHKGDNIMNDSGLPGFNLLLHTEGESACFGPALQLGDKLGLGDVPIEGDVLHVDGTPYKTGDKVFCDTCRHLVLINPESVNG